MTSADEVAALLRENARLSLQSRKLQGLVATMRDEIADANAEIAASKRLFEEERELLLQELEQERSWREALAKQLQARSSSKVSVGTNTLSEASTSTTSECGVMTETGGFSGAEMFERPAVGFGRDLSPLQQFAEWLGSRANFKSQSLMAVFDTLGAGSVEEVCANVQEKDLVACGVPVVKARTILHLIMEHTALLLAAPPPQITPGSNRYQVFRTPPRF